LTSWRAPYIDNSYCCCVFPVVFAPVFVIYTVSSAGSQILRYALLQDIIEHKIETLPFVVGTTDAVMTLVHIIIELSRRWNTYTAEVVDKPFGGVLAAILYRLGSL
jgi:hypothetical protein